MATFTLSFSAAVHRASQNFCMQGLLMSSLQRHFDCNTLLHT